MEGRNGNMDSFIINGGKPLKGTVNISGSKNAALPILISTILSKNKVRLDNVPRVSDVDFVQRLLVELGGNLHVQKGAHGLSVNVHFGDEIECVAPYDLVRKMRASILVLSPLLARYGKVKVSMPGGCAIGARPIDLHLMVVEKLGAKIETSGGYITATAKRLSGTEIVFPFVSVGATQTAMMASVLAKGKTVLRNVSIEPETIQVGEFLNFLGAGIEGLGTETVTVNGLDSDGLPGSDSVFDIIPDRIEAGTYAIAAAATRGKVLVNNALHKHLDILLFNLKESGVKVDIRENGFEIDATHLDSIRPVDVITSPYPGFPTDLQAQWMAYMCTAKGTARIGEHIFENRFIHAGELLRLGARIKVNNNTATVTGVPSLTGAPVMATDLRASAWV
jgi:UDP-N-acetylglucosamine 1-carboxyvinyltransferase